MYRNPILSVDSYKLSHFKQYPKSTIGMFAYIEARKNNSGLKGLQGTMFFGLQAFVKEYMLRQITMADVDKAVSTAKKHGLPFPEAGFRKVVTQYNGYLPVLISAVREGTHVPFGNALVSVQCYDRDLFWLASYVETMLLRGVWYPTTVATVSSSIRTVIKRFLDETSDDPEGQLPFKLHDFGARGASSGETAAIGGMAHLATGFLGTDTMEALLAAEEYYGCEMAGFSIPASEHSTITAWGREFEVDAYRNMIKEFSKPGSIYAVVSDSYDIYNAADKLWGQVLKQEVIDGQGMLVVRPDSGDPVETPVRVIQILAKRFGYTVNKKGFKVLNNVRVIQGDGIGPFEIERILNALKINGYSADNIAFGMGGGLLQKVDRDTFSFAQKASAVMDEEKGWIDVFKDPIGGGKTSKKGLLALVMGEVEKLEGGEYVKYNALKTVREEESDYETYLLPVYYKGTLFYDDPFDAIRKRANETKCYYPIQKEIALA